jgi:hypothetical protein
VTSHRACLHTCTSHPRGKWKARVTRAPVIRVHMFNWSQSFYLSTGIKVSVAMQATMPTSPTRPEYKPVHIPRLSYRNSDSIDPSQLSARNSAAENEDTIADLPRNTSSVRSKTPPSTHTSAGSENALRLSSSRGNERLPKHSKPQVSPTTQKKKSLFGGLFVAKEPTGVALVRLAAQLEAQHGELSARAIPGVSSAKLPEHVPKVNAKWDGVPEAVKERDRLQKEKARATKKQSRAPSDRSRSAEGSRDANARAGDRRLPLQKRSSTSTLSSFDSRGRNGHARRSQFSSSDDARSLSKTLSSDAEDGRLAKAASIRSQSLRTPSGSSLPHITAFFPNDILHPPAVPKRYKSKHRTHTASTQRTTSTNWTRYDHADALADLAIDVVPEHTSSPNGTPFDRSPVTPSPMLQSPSSSRPSILPVSNNRSEEAVFVSSGANVLGPPATATIKRKTKASRDAFLAGEARPFELPDDEPGPAVIEYELRSPDRTSTAPELPALARGRKDLENRPDSSRARLGLRASMLVSPGQTPWNWQDLDKSSEVERGASPRLSMPTVPKSLSKVLGKVSK